MVLVKVRHLIVKVYRRTQLIWYVKLDLACRCADLLGANADAIWDSVVCQAPCRRLACILALEMCLYLTTGYRSEIRACRGGRVAV